MLFRSAAPGQLVFTLPNEGYPRFADNIAILRESRRTEAAHRWINYLLRPEVAASIVETTHTASTNEAATRLLSPAARENPVLYPPEIELARGEWFQAQAAAPQKLRDRLWTEIKSA